MEGAFTFDIYFFNDAFPDKSTALSIGNEPINEIGGSKSQQSDRAMTVHF